MEELQHKSVMGLDGGWWDIFPNFKLYLSIWLNVFVQIVKSVTGRWKCEGARVVGLAVGRGWSQPTTGRVDERRQFYSGGETAWAGRFVKEKYTSENLRNTIQIF